MNQAPARRVGIFGGAFDPPHRMHVALAQAAVEQLDLDLLHVIPTGEAWHKTRTLSAAEHRLAMCRLAFENVAAAQIDNREILRSGPTFTIDTLQQLQSLYPGAQLFLIIGEDQARALNSWHRFDQILRAAIICVAVRAPDVGAKGLQDTRFELLPQMRSLQIDASPLSASQIREAVQQGQSVSTLVLEPVARYIEQHHLYQTA